MKRSAVCAVPVLFILGFVISCGGGGGGGGGSTPSYLVSAEEGVFKVNITWDEVPGAISYNIYWRDFYGPVTTADKKIAGVSSPYTHSGISPFKVHSYIVTMVDASSTETVIGSEVSAVPRIPSRQRKLTASDGQADDLFGRSVSMDGDYAIVGAFYEDAGGTDAGGAYVYYRHQGGTDNWGEVAKLTASDAQASDYFGIAVSMSGDFAIVGAVGEDTAGADAGAAYVYHRNQGGPDNWGEVVKLTASDAQAGDWFGYSVSASQDRVIVAAVNEDAAGTEAGAAYIFYQHQGGMDAWGEVGKLTASDGQAGDLFGRSVSVSGDIAIVGAHNEDTWGPDAGAAYVFYRDQGGTDNWGEVTKLTASDAQASDHFGNSVSMSKDHAIVGAFYESDGGTAAGAAYIFYRHQGGTDAWGEVTKLTASDPQAFDQFGISVSMDGDYVAVGAYLEDSAASNGGAVYVYYRNQGGTDNWGEVSKLTARDPHLADWYGESVSISSDYVLISAIYEDSLGTDAGAVYISYIDPDRNKKYASDARTYNLFGSSLSISGDYAIIGASGEGTFGTSTGAAYVLYRHQGGTDNWGEIAKLTASDGQPGDNFGISVSIDEAYAIVGAHAADTGVSNAGAAYVFYQNQGGLDAWGEVAKLVSPNPEANDEFGRSVSISDGYAIVGAPGDDTEASNAGAAYVFYENQGGYNNWGEVAVITASDALADDFFGWSVSMSGGIALVGAIGKDAAGIDAGGAYVYNRDLGVPDSWVEVARLMASDAQPNDIYGISVSISGYFAVVGANGEGSKGIDAGAAYVYSRHLGGTDAWGEDAKLTASDGQAYDYFGYSVSIHRDHITVGAFLNDSDGTDTGAAYVYYRYLGGASAWGEIVKLTAPNARPNEAFGYAVAVSDDNVFVGAAGEGTWGFNAGALYIY